MKKKDNPLDKKEFRSIQGRCAFIAIAYMFALNVKGIKAIFKAYGWNEKRDDGVTATQCKKVIELLCNIKKLYVRYHTNRRKWNASTFLSKHPKGWFLLNQDGHVSAARNGLFIDSWEPDSFDLIGWWEISKKPFIEYCKKCTHVNIHGPSLTYFRLQGTARPQPVVDVYSAILGRVHSLCH